LLDTLVDLDFSISDLPPQRVARQWSRAHGSRQVPNVSANAQRDPARIIVD